MELDYHDWLQKQAGLLRSRDVAGLDWDNLAEELEAMAARERRELRARLTVLLARLLKWQYQADHRSNSWKHSINEGRDAVKDLLKDSPSLRARVAEILPEAYQRAPRDAGVDTGYDRARFPIECPWDFDALVRDDFWPEPSDPANSSQ